MAETLKIRRSKIEDIPRMLEIYAYAREQMRLNGNPNQWITYPKRELLESDIEKKISYVVTDGDRICGTFVFIIGEDPTYTVIEDGEWLNSKKYGTIHRIASDGTVKGILDAAVDFGSLRVSNIRLDTHNDNVVMQKAAEKLGFKRCGTIYCSDDISDHSPRIAYHKVLEDETNYIAIGLCLGMGIGVALGSAFHNIGLGIALGMCFGVFFGAITGKSKKEQ